MTDASNRPGIPATLSGVVLTGHGGFDKLRFRTDLPVPRVAKGEVLIRVAAWAISNTDISTRIRWYSKAVRESTAESGAPRDKDASGTGEALRFPRIQGPTAAAASLPWAKGSIPKASGTRWSCGTFCAPPAMPAPRS